MTDRRILDLNARILLDADDYMESRGWCQGSSTDVFDASLASEEKDKIPK